MTVSPYYVQVFLSLSLVLVYSHPAPQIEDKSDDSYDDDYYGDYDAEAASDAPAQGGLEDILRLGAGLAEGLLTLLGEKVKIINGLLSDKVGVQIIIYFETASGPISARYQTKEYFPQKSYCVVWVVKYAIFTFD